MRIKSELPLLLKSPIETLAENNTASKVNNIAAEIITANISPTSNLSEGYASHHGIDLTKAQLILASLGENNSINGLEQSRATNLDGHLIGSNREAFSPQTPLDKISAVAPLNGRTNNETIVYINGINEGVELQSRNLQSIADATGSHTIGIHNLSKGSTLDVLQSIGDKIGISNNPATETLAHVVYDEIRAGRSVHLFAHSQGAIITSNALTAVREWLQQDGLSVSQAETLLSQVKVETSGSIARRFPDGPQYVHYINSNDSVAESYGMSSSLRAGLMNPFVSVSPGRGAVVHRFSAGSGNSAHELAETYLRYRIPFEQARSIRTPINR